MSGVVHVAVVFTDLVSSTALASRVGPEAAEQVRKEHFQILRTALSAHGGREVKNLGDGLMIAFDRSSAAVASGVAMQQSIDRRNRTQPDEPLAIRVGISVGEADVDDDGDLFGPPVVEAARLCGIAEGGQVLVTEALRLVTGSRGGFDFGATERRELKGIPGPVGVVAVGWTPLGHGDENLALSVPLPTGLDSGATLAGRAGEVAALRDAWEAASAGRGGVAVISGEAGIGKTTLLDALAGGLHREGAVVVYGRCNEDLGVPYAAWMEALGHLVDHVPGELLDAHVEQRGAGLSRLVPALARRVEAPPSRSTDDETERFMLFASVADLLGGVAERAPLLIVLDDLHWADRETLHLLRHLVTSEGFERTLLAITYRGTDVDEFHPLAEVLAALHRLRTTVSLELEGLDGAGLLGLMEGAAGHPLGPDAAELRDVLAAETAGNPFFAREVLRHLLETGAIARSDDGHWVATTDLTLIPLPVGVRRVMSERVARLGPAVGEVLRSAAVIGREFDLELLALASGTGEDELVDLLDRAVSAAMVVNLDATRFSFAHALVERTLYDDLTPAKRARRHRRVALAIEELCGVDIGVRAAELAKHWDAAGVPGDRHRVLHYTCLAGRRAMEALAPDEAVRWFLRALDLLEHIDDDASRAEVLLELGRAEQLAGEAAHREHLLETARIASRLGLTEVLVSAALANTRGHFSAVGTVDAARVAVLEGALDASASDDSPTRARLLATLASELTFGDHQRRDEAAAKAIEMARRCGDTDAILDTTAMTGTFRTVPWLLDELEKSTALALELTVGHPDRHARYRALHHSRNVALMRGERADSRQYFAEMRDIASELGLPALHWAATHKAGVEALLDGDLVLAERLVGDAMELGPLTGQPDAFTFDSVQLMTVRYHQGRLGELVDLVASAGADNPQIPGYAVGLAAAHAQAGDREAAQEVFARFMVGAADVPADLFWATAMTIAADTAVFLGDRPAAEWLHGRLLPYRDQVVVLGDVGCMGPVAQQLGCLAKLLGRTGGAADDLEEALRLSRSLQSPLHIAAAAAQLGPLLEERDPRRARELGEEARRLLATVGGPRYAATETAQDG